MTLKRFEMWWPSELLDAIDAWRNQQPAFISRAAAMRYLLKCGIEWESWNKKS
jgi:hypothetical protein